MAVWLDIDWTPIWISLICVHTLCSFTTINVILHLNQIVTASSWIYILNLQTKDMNAFVVVCVIACFTKQIYIFTLSTGQAFGNGMYCFDTWSSNIINESKKSALA